jgi:hypothetical protein
MKKDVVKSSNTAKIEIESIPIHQKILDYFKEGVLDHILKEDENIVFKIVLQSPKTTRDIRNKFIEYIDYIFVINGKPDDFFSDSKENYILIDKKFGSKLYPVEKIARAEDVLGFGQGLGGEYDKLKSNYLDQKISYTEYITKLESLLKRSQCILSKIPSYDRIETILNSLNRMGLIIKRKEAFKGSKFLWVSNPELLIEIEKDNLKIQKEKYKILTNQFNENNKILIHQLDELLNQLDDFLIKISI